MSQNKPVKEDILDSYYGLEPITIAPSTNRLKNTEFVYEEKDGLYFIKQIIQYETRWGLWVKNIYYRSSDDSYWAVEFEKTNEASHTSADIFSISNEEIVQVYPKVKVIIDYE